MKITINDITLSSDFLSVPAQGSANIPVELENLSEEYADYALVPCVGWIENGVIVSTTRKVISSNNKKIFTLPAECFKNPGAIYISIGLVKDDEKVKTNEIVLFVGEAPESDVELPSKSTWETAVSSLVSSLFNERFENEIDKILEDAKNLNKKTGDLQQEINVAIGNLGDYEWSGTKIRFRLGDGSWGDYRDIAGDFAKESELTELKNAFTSVTSLTKQLFLLMHPVGCIYMSTSSTSPQTTFGGTWIGWGNGRVPVGVDTSDPDFNTVEKTGGEKTHKLLMKESYWNVQGGNPINVQDGGQKGYLVANNSGQQAFNIQQEYITCYMWKRIA